MKEMRKVYDMNRLKDNSLAKSDIQGTFPQARYSARGIAKESNKTDDIAGTASHFAGFHRKVESNPTDPVYDTESSIC